MTKKEIARALESLIREDAKRPPAEQIRDLLEAGIIDEQGRVLIGFWNKTRQEPKAAKGNGPGEGPSPPRGAGT